WPDRIPVPRVDHRRGRLSRTDGGDRRNTPAVPLADRVPDAVVRPQREPGVLDRAPGPEVLELDVGTGEVIGARHLELLDEEVRGFREDAGVASLALSINLGHVGLDDGA